MKDFSAFQEAHSKGEAFVDDPKSGQPMNWARFVTLTNKVYTSIKATYRAMDGNLYEVELLKRDALQRAGYDLPNAAYHGLDDAQKAEVRNWKLSSPATVAAAVEQLGATNPGHKPVNPDDIQIDVQYFDPADASDTNNPFYVGVTNMFSKDPLGGYAAALQAGSRATRGSRQAMDALKKQMSALFNVEMNASIHEFTQGLVTDTLGQAFTETIEKYIATLVTYPDAFFGSATPLALETEARLFVYQTIAFRVLHDGNAALLSVEDLLKISRGVPTGDPALSHLDNDLVDAVRSATVTAIEKVVIPEALLRSYFGDNYGGAPLADRPAQQRWKGYWDLNRVNEVLPDLLRIEDGKFYTPSIAQTIFSRMDVNVRNLRTFRSRSEREGFRNKIAAIQAAESNLIQMRVNSTDTSNNLRAAQNKAMTDSLAAYVDTPVTSQVDIVDLAAAQVNPVLKKIDPAAVYRHERTIDKTQEDYLSSGFHATFEVVPDKGDYGFFEDNVKKYHRTSKQLLKAPKSADDPGAGDLIILDTSLRDGIEPTIKEAIALLEAGYAVRLIHRDKSGQKRDEHTAIVSSLQAIGTYGSSGSLLKLLYAPDEGVSADERSRLSSLFSRRRVTIHNRIVGFAPKIARQTNEQAGYLWNPDAMAARERSLNTQFVPNAAASSFKGARNVHQRSNLIKEARNFREALELELARRQGIEADAIDPDTPIYNHLLTQTLNYVTKKKDKGKKTPAMIRAAEELRESIQRFVEYDPTTLTHAQNDLNPPLLQEGDFFLAEMEGALLIQRYGKNGFNKKAKEDELAAVRNQLRAWRGTAGMPIGVAISSPEHDGSITAKGTVEIINMVSVYGGMQYWVSGEIVDPWTKTTIGEGFKVTNSPTPPGPAPQFLSVVQNKIPVLEFSQDDALGKELYSGKLTADYARRAGILGHSFIEPLSRALGLADKYKAAMSQADPSVDLQLLVQDIITELKSRAGRVSTVNPTYVHQNIELMIRGIMDKVRKASAVTSDTMDAALLDAFVVAATEPGVDLAYLIASDGILRDRPEGLEGLGMIGEFMDSLAYDNPLREAQLADHQTRLQEFFGDRVWFSPNGSSVLAEYIGEDGDVRYFEADLFVSEFFRGSQDSPTVQTQTGSTRWKENYSQSLADFLYQGTWGAKLSHTPDISELRAIRRHKNKRNYTLKALVEAARGDDFPIELSAWNMEAPGEVLYRRTIREHVQNMERPLDYDHWTDPEKKEYETLKKDLAKALHLDESMVDTVDHLVRRYLWAGKVKDSKPGEGQYGWVPPFKAQEAVKDMLSKVKAGRFPTYMNATGAMSSNEVQAIAYGAYQALHNGVDNVFLPDIQTRLEVDGEGKRRKYRQVVTDTEQPTRQEFLNMTLEEFTNHFVNVAVAELMETPRSSYDVITADAYLATYEQYFSSELGTASLRTEYATALNLFDPELNNLIASLDIRNLDKLREMSLMDQEFHESVGVYFGTSYGLDESWEVFKDVRTNNAAISKARRAFERKLGQRSAPRTGTERLSKRFVLDQRTNHQKRMAVSHLVSASILMRLSNPFILFGAPLEIKARGAVEGTTSAIQAILGGELSTRSLGEVGAWLRGAADNLVVSGALSSIQSTIFKHYEITAYDTTFVDQGIQWLTRMQGIARRKKHAASAFIDSITRSILNAPEMYLEQGATLESALSLLETNWEAFRDHPVYGQLWKMGERAVADGYGIRETTLSYALSRVIGHLTNKRGFLGGSVEVLLRGPAAFHGFWTNVLVQVIGAQGVDEMLRTGTAYLLSRTNRDDLVTVADQMLEQAQTEIDLTNLFLRGAVSQVGAMALAAALSNVLGLLGDDEEEEERKELLQKGIVTPYDITRLQNSWLHADSYFVDNIPVLRDIFAVATDENGEPVAPVMPAWWVRQFTDGFLGWAKFWRSGDPMDVIDGYASAFGSMPLAAPMLNLFSAFTGLQGALFDQAAVVSGDTVIDGDAGSEEFLAGLLKIAMNYERIYFEWGFLNTLYTGFDEYTRDPFTVPDMNAEATLQTDKLGNVVETTMEEPKLNSEGEPYMGAPQFDSAEATMRGYASQRLGVALFRYFTTGFDISNFRLGMPIKEEQIQKTDLTDSEAETVILSEWNTALGHEVLTDKGAEAMIAGLYYGLVGGEDNSAVLENLYIPPEQRVRVRDALIERFAQDALEMGATDEAAKEYVSHIMYGDPYRPNQTPLNDVIFSQGTHEGQIPYSPVSTYQYLNTTFVKGPDGKYWPTGVVRNHPIWGFAGAFQAYMGAEGVGRMGNLGTDDMGNSVNEIGKVNTGLRALTYKPEQQAAMNLESLGEGVEEKLSEIIESLRQGQLKDDRRNNNRGGYGGYSRGGGGGGGGYARNTLMPYLNGMRSPYWDNLPTIYADNPIIRRATIRRERFSSERGRLNQWQ